MNLHTTASNICAEDGEVHIDGPGGTALAMTPEAAMETSNRLLRASLHATGQQLGYDQVKRGD